MKIKIIFYSLIYALLFSVISVLWIIVSNQARFYGMSRIEVMQNINESIFFSIPLYFTMIYSCYKILKSKIKIPKFKLLIFNIILLSFVIALISGISSLFSFKITSLSEASYGCMANWGDWCSTGFVLSNFFSLNIIFYFIYLFILSWIRNSEIKKENNLA